MTLQSNLSTKTTHGEEENWSLFTGGFYSEGQFYIHWTNLRRQGLFTAFIHILIGTSQLHVISEMISEKLPKATFCKRLYYHSKF